MTVRQHIPSSMDFESKSAEVDSLEALLALPWIDRWVMAPGFYRLSISPRTFDTLLLAEFDTGRRWFVIAYLESAYVQGDIVPWVEQLPFWKDPKPIT